LPSTHAIANQIHAELAYLTLLTNYASAGTSPSQAQLHGPRTIRSSTLLSSRRYGREQLVRQAWLPGIASAAASLSLSYAASTTEASATVSSTARVDVCSAAPRRARRQPRAGSRPRRRLVWYCYCLKTEVQERPGQDLWPQAARSHRRRHVLAGGGTPQGRRGMARRL